MLAGRLALGRLRAGEVLVAGGAAGLFALLFCAWFGADVQPRAELNRSGWTSLGWLLVALLVVTMLAAAALVAATLAEGAVAPAVVAGVITAVLGTLTFPALLVRVTVAQPGLGAGLPDGVVGATVCGYLGLVACGAIAAGGWWSIADERTDAPESAYTPPAPRRAPPAGA